MLQQHLWRLGLFSLPLTWLAFSLFSVRTEVAYSDEAILLYGFPWPWYAPSPVSTGAYDVAWVAALLDFCLYLLAVDVLCLLLRPWQRLGAGMRRACSALLWLAALLTAAWYGVLILQDVQFVRWELDAYFDASAQRSYALQLGLARMRN